MLLEIPQEELEEAAKEISGLLCHNPNLAENGRMDGCHFKLETSRGDT